jgi:DNA polymerase-3 subunit delta'
MELSWLKPLIESWQSSQSQGRPPHAVMLTGTPGSGKRAAAAWLARSRLGIAGGSAMPEYPWTIPEHADLRWITPPEDKHAIGIDQIRELVSEISLTSYQGGGKVAVIDPADAMTTNAANSLLKTLEEPPGDTLLVLVVDRPGRLPATIVSRCQRMNIRVPAEQDGMAWLQRFQAGANWAKVLREAGYAPLAAVEGMARLGDTQQMASDFAALAAGREAPLQVAARWSKHDPQFVLGWLGRQVQMCISKATNGASAGDSAAVGDSVLERIDRRKMFCYLDIINRLRSQPAGSFNVQLTLECLLIDWAERLESPLGIE